MQGRAVPLGVKHIQKLLRIHFLAGCEDHNLEQGCAALQEGVQMGSPAHVHLMLAPIEGNGKAEVRLLAAIQRAVHKRLIQVKNLEATTPITQSVLLAQVLLQATAAGTGMDLADAASTATG